MRAKRHAFLGDFAKLVQAENLKSPRVSQDCPWPCHETVQPAQLADGFDSGTQVEMISIAKKNLNPEFFKNVLRHAFDGGNRADRHENRGFDFSMGRDQPPGARLLPSGLDAKLNRHGLKL